MGDPADDLDRRLESLLASRSAVADVAVLRRTAADGRTYRVVHVVPAPGVDPTTMRQVVDAADLLTTGPTADPSDQGGQRSPTPPDPLLLAVISRIPRHAGGRPDAAALAALPVVAHGAALDPVPDPPPGRLHLDPLLDLPPRWHPDHTSPVADGRTVRADGEDPAGEMAVAPRALCVGEDPEPHRHEDDPAELVDALLSAVRRTPDLGVHVVGEAGERFVRYPELLDAARRVLTALRAQGLGPGDPVLLHLPDLGDHLVCLWACLLGGLRPVAVAQAPGYGERNAVLDKLEHAWRTLHGAPVLSGGGTAAALREYGRRAGWAGLRVLDLADCRDAEPATALHSPAPEEVAFLQLSSGSTGRSKVIRITHAGVIRYAQAARTVGRTRPDDVFVNWLPLDHVVGTLSFHLAPIVLRCQQVHAETGLVLADPPRWLDLLQRHRAAHSWSPNFGFKLIADAVRAAPDRRWDLRSVRTLVNAGEQCTEPVMAEFLAAVEPFGITAPVVVLGWGMAETCTMICHQPLTPAAVQHVRRSGADGRLTLLDSADEPGASTLLSMGPPDPGTEFRITGDGHAGDAAAVLPELTIGRLQVRSARVTPGYLNNPTADAEAFVGDGWFDTGDLAFAAGGRITITGRAKEIIIINGVHHFCHEIEDVVGAVDGVTAGLVAAVGVPSAAGTEQLAVLFVPRSFPVAATVPAAVREALARRLQLTAAALVPLPHNDFDRTTSGKIQRAAMRARLLTGAHDDAVRAIELVEAGPRTVPDCLYRPQWTPRPFPLARPTDATDLQPMAGPAHAGTVVVADRLGLARAIADGVPGAVVVDPAADARSWQNVLRPQDGPPPRRIVFAAGYVPTPTLPGTDEPVDGGGRDGGDGHDKAGVDRLLTLYGALAAVGWSGELVTVSRGLYRVRGDEDGCHPAAPLAALAEVIAAESPAIRAWHLDLPGDAVDQDAAAIVQSAAWSHREPAVAWRGLPYVRALRRVEPRAAAPAPEPGSCWLVTGGLGGIGRLLCPVLTDEFGLRLLVVGRTAGRPRDDAGIGVHDGTGGGVGRPGGQVEFAAVDVADGAALRRVVEEAERRWGAPLAGVLHLAGGYDVQLLQDLDRSRWADRTAAKIAGSLTVAELLLARPGARLVAFSSLVSLLPAVGTGTYAAGNRFLEALCEHLADRVPVHCVGWGLWRGVGISAEHGYTEQLSQDRVLALSASEATSLFRIVLRQPPGHLLVGVHPGAAAVRPLIEPPRVLAHDRARPPTDPFGTPAPTMAPPSTGPDTTPQAQSPDGSHRPHRIEPARTAGRPGAGRPGGGRQGLVRTIREVLGGVGRGDLDPHTAFYEGGLDSVRLLQVHTRLQRAIGTEFPQTVLFDHPTIAALADHLGGSGNGQVAHDLAGRQAGTGDDRRIAVIGTALRFPGADTVRRYWANVLAGRVSVRRFDRAELLAAGLPASLVDDPEFVPVGGTIGDIGLFDAELFGITGREAALLDPQQRLFLQVCHEAMENAGHTGAGVPTGVYAGSGMNLYSLRSYLLANLSDTDPGDYLAALQVTIGNQPDFLASRVAHRLGLTGPAVGVQTACSTSLVAVHLACQALLSGEVELALAGAAAVHVPQAAGYRHQEGSILSRHGTCRAFDAEADGTVGGSGVAAVVLKRLDAAMADGDTVHAVILGSAVNNDGAAKAGYTAPSATGQAAVIRAALAAAGVEPSSIGYVETHGTGTPLGDPIEVEGLRQVFGGRAVPLPLGSAKPNIGHLDSCAGMAGLIRAVQAVAHGTVPPLAGLRTPHPGLRLDDGPFELPTVARPWPVDGPRRAGVSAFGIGGTNAHLVLEQPPTPAVIPTSSVPEIHSPATSATAVPDIRAMGAVAGAGPAAAARVLVPLSAAGEAALTELAARMAERLTERPAPRPEDLLRTLGDGRRHRRHRLLAWGDSADEAAAALRAFARGEPGEPGGHGRGGVVTGVVPAAGVGGLAFAFTGQGVDCTGMARGLDRYPPLWQVLVECDEYHREHWGASLLEPMLAPRHEWTTELVQPALFALQVGAARLLEHVGVRPDVLVGHSAGEYSALCVAGALSVTDGLHLAAVRGSLLGRTASGAMLAVFADEPTVREVTDGLAGVGSAVRNGPANHVIAGTLDGIAEAEEALHRAGLDTRRLPTDRGFHSALVDPVLDELDRHAGALAWRPLRLPVVSNLGGRLLEPGTVPGPGHVRRQTREPADYRACVDAVVEDGVHTFVELGPEAVLCGLGRAWPATTWIPLRRRADAEPVVGMLGTLFAGGVDVDWSALDPGGRRVPLPTYPFQQRRHWIDPQPRTEGRHDMPAPEVGDPSTALTSVVCERVRELTARQLHEDLDRVTADRDFLDLGADSLLIINLLRELQAIFGVRVAMRELFEQADTPALLAALIADRIDPARAAGLTGTATPPTTAPPPAVPALLGSAAVEVASPTAGPPAAPAEPWPVVAPTPSAAPAPTTTGVEALVAEQLQVLNRVSALLADQLTTVTGRATTQPWPAAPPGAAVAAATHHAVPQQAVPQQAVPQTAGPGEASDPVEPRQVGPRVSGAGGSGMTAGSLDPRQRRHFDALVERYTARTARSKEIAQRYRRTLADSRAVVGFRRATKELLYPIAGRRARGAYLEDVDGNTYVDITMGFGTLLFGHEPPFVTDAVREHLDRGLQLGPRNEETGRAAELLCELTGMDRAAFATTGTEANSAAFRLARAFTGRDLIVTFDGSYHGHFDPVLGRPVRDGGRLRTVPVSAGIPESAVAEVLVLDYGAEQSLEVIGRAADRIAAVVVEVVPSRHPDRRPVEFVRALRQLCDRHGIVLLFDEMLTGFRPHPRGAAGVFDVRPDLATYGKVLGGGYPIGAIAGRADIMDWVDGGFWSYGDDSAPPGETTFFGGTYIQHPVSMVAATAVLTHLRQHSPDLQRRLTERTERLAGELNRFCADEEFPLRVDHFGSMFRFAHRGNLELLFTHLMLEGVHVWEWRNFFLSDAHTDADVDVVIDAVRNSLHDLRGGGFLPGGRSGGRFPERRPVVRNWDSLVPQRNSDHGPERNGTGAVATDEPGRTRPDFSVYFFGDYPRDGAEDKYRLVLEAARFADRSGLHAVWLPERHFHSFGGVFPNPSVLAAALATTTRRIRLNAGSVVLPLHDPIRVAEEWSVVDNLSGGRVGLGCASGWHATDFVLAPDNYGRHKEAMYEAMATIRELWRGGTVERTAGNGEAVRVQLFPRPLQAMPPFYTAIVGNPDSYRRAAAEDIGIITNLMSQSVDQLAANIALYRRTRAEHGLDPAAGRVVLLLHSFLGADGERARREAFTPFCDYLRSSLSLFGQVTNSLGFSIDLDDTPADDVEYMLRRAYERYCADRALIGSPAECEPIVRRLAELGVDEISCFLDFGVPTDGVIDALPHLADLRRRFATDQATHEAPDGSSGTGRADGSRSGPMSAAQRQVWAQERLLPGRPTYTESAVVRIDGPLDVDALRRSLQTAVDRHAGLRTVFREVDGEPRQVVLPAHEVLLPVARAATDTGTDAVTSTEPSTATGADPRVGIEAAVDAAARRAVEEETAHVFDLARGPLFDPRLVAVTDDVHLLVLRMHHLVMDTWSAGILTREVSALYPAAVDGGPPPTLEPAGDPLAAHPAGDVHDAADLQYWAGRHLPRPAELRLPTDRPRPARSTGRGGTAGLVLDPDLTDRVRRAAKAHRSTPFMVLLAAFATVLRRLSGMTDFVVGTPMAARPEGSENTVGFFVGTVPLRLTQADDACFAELLAAVRTEVLDAAEHGSVPVDAMLRAIGAPTDPGRHPLFGVCVEFDNEVAFEFDLPGLRTTALDVAVARAPFDLTLMLAPAGDGLRCRIAHDADLFRQDTVQRLLAHFRFVLDQAIEQPRRPLRELPPAPVDEELLASWQRGEDPVDVPVALHERPLPGCAVVDADGTSTPWDALDRRADAVAAALRDAGVGQDQVVGVHLPRCADAVAAMLGVLRLGAAYLPLDPEHPAARLAVMAEAAGAVAVVTRSGLSAPPDGLPTVVVDALGEPPAGGVPGPVADPSRVAYLMFTSGSTGSPKGVVVQHGAIANTLAWYVRRLGITATDRVCWFSSPGFDASCTDVWSALRTGATLYVVPPAARFDPRQLRDWLVDNGIAAVFLPTKLGEALLRLDPPDAGTALRHLVTGGERMRATVPPGLPFEVINAYGPTEACVYTTWSDALPHDADGPPPIGRPMPGTSVLVLDGDGRQVPIGAVGELHIGGAQLARGYVGAPAETDRRFVTHPRHGRLYRTGDLVHWGSDGQLYYVGRNDDQVQIRGQRAEPGEVEHHLRGLDGVADAAVLAGTDVAGDPYLAGYVVPAHDRPSPTTAELADLLRRRLPEFLVPTRWAVLERLPVNANGKLDPSALPEPTLPRSPGTNGTPTSELERRLQSLWCEQLGLDTVDVEASFFHLGGTSLTVTRLLNRVRTRFGRGVDTLDFFTTPTVRGMAALLTTDADTDTDALAGIAVTDENDSTGKAETMNA